MVYRDDYERCPRCGTELIDAGSVRQCTTCRGMWAAEAVLVQMAAAMHIPERPVSLPCPSCQEPMGTWKLHAVEIDRCERDGIWFDRDELEKILFVSFGRDK